MSEVLRFKMEFLPEGVLRECVYAADFDRVTADLASANADKEAYAQNAIDLRKRIDALQQDLNQRDEQIAALDLQREAHMRNSQVVERRVAVLEGLLCETSALLRVGAGYGWEDRAADRIDAALKPAEGRNPSTCTWSHDGIGIWSGSCGTKWAFTDDGPTENGMRFCHCCGKALVVETAEGGGDEAI